MEKLEKPRPISDIVYQYVYITPIEEKIIDLPIFQRLRFIKQNSAGYLTFPSNKLDRFSHSLGVMHVGGEMLINACQNSDPKTVEEFIREVKKEIEITCTNLGGNYTEEKKIWLKKFGNISNFNFSFLYLSKEEENTTTNKVTLENEDYIFSFNIMWQSLRIACCLHDIGHYPYSHIFEEAINDLGFKGHYNPREEVETIFRSVVNNLRLGVKFEKGNQIATHEQISSILFANKITPNFSNGYDGLGKLCTKLALKIFLTYRQKAGAGQQVHYDTQKAFYCLHTIISSDVDADRLDYTMRDCMYAGLDMGKFDYKRLLNSLKIKILCDPVDKKKYFEIIVNGKAISSIERFFHQRFILYKYFIHHHNNSRYNGILIEIIRLLVRETMREGPLKNTLEEFQFYTPLADTEKKETKLLNIEKYQYFEDGWLRTLLLRINDKLNLVLSNEIEVKKIGESELIIKKRLNLLIETFIFRKSNNVISLWKRDIQADKILEEIISKLDEGNLHKAMKNLYGEEIRINRQREIKFIKRKINAIPDDSIKSPIGMIKQRLSKNSPSVILIYTFTKPKIFDSTRNGNPIKVEVKDYSKVNSGYDEVKCHEASGYLASLKQASYNLFHHQFAFVSDNIKNSNTLIADCRKIVIEEYQKYLNEILVPPITISDTIQQSSLKVNLSKAKEIKPKEKSKSKNASQKQSKIK
jgi:HD superfamily phosphohydrolase